MSTQILISFGFDGLGTTTIGGTLGVRPSACSVMSSFSSCLSLSSTCFLTWNRMRQCSCATGLTDSSMCMRIGSPLYSPIPLSKQGKSLRKSGTPSGKFVQGCLTVLTALMTFNFCDVIQLRMDPEEPSTM